MPSITGFLEIDKILWVILLGIFIVFFVDTMYSRRSSERKGLSDGSSVTSEKPQGTPDENGLLNNNEQGSPRRLDNSSKEEDDPLPPVGNMRGRMFDRLFKGGPGCSNAFWTIFCIPFLLICWAIGDLLGKRLELELLGHILLDGIIVYIVCSLLAKYIEKD